MADSWAIGRLQPWRLRRAASGEPRGGGCSRWPWSARTSPTSLPAARAELLRSHHDVRFATDRRRRDRGKFENLNALLERNPPDGHDWLLVLDDDVALPRGFLDAFLFLVERFGLQLAQPAHRASRMRHGR